MKKYASVAEFLDDLEPAKRQQVELLRAIIFEAQPGLDEHIKWNSPSYGWEGSDRITFNLQNKEGVVRLVLHMDTARVEDKRGTPVMLDDEGLVIWQSDIRGILSLVDIEDIKAKQSKVLEILKRWLAIQP